MSGLATIGTDEPFFYSSLKVLMNTCSGKTLRGDPGQYTPRSAVGGWMVSWSGGPAVSLSVVHRQPEDTHRGQSLGVAGPHGEGRHRWRPDGRTLAVLGLGPSGKSGSCRLAVRGGTSTVEAGWSGSCSGGPAGRGRPLGKRTAVALWHWPEKHLRVVLLVIPE